MRRGLGLMGSGGSLGYPTAAVARVPCLIAVRSDADWPGLRLSDAHAPAPLRDHIYTALGSSYDIHLDLREVQNANPPAAAFLVAIARQLTAPQRLLLHDTPRSLASLINVLWMAQAPVGTCVAAAGSSIHQARQFVCLQP
jgi:hypothetical protein